MEAGWVTPEYPDSRYLVYEKDGEEREFVTMLFENDCKPEDEVFTEDLLAAVREEAAAGKEQSAETEQDEENERDTAENKKEAALTALLARWRKSFCARDAEALAEYEDMPELTFELSMRRRGNGDVVFELGDRISRLQ